MKKLAQNSSKSHLFSIYNRKEKFRNVPIRKKLITSFILISIIGCVSGILGLIFLQTTSKEYSKALTNYGVAQGDLGKLGIEIEKSNSAVRDFLFLKNEDRDAAKKELNEALENVDEQLNTIENYSLNDEELQTLKNIRLNLVRYKQVRNNVSSCIIGDRQDEGLVIFRKDGSPIMNEITDDIGTLLQNKINQCNELKSKLNNIKNINIILVMVTILCSITISLIIAGRLSNSISSNINKIKKCVEEMAEGNLEIAIDVDSKDELGMLAMSFSQMVSTLKAYINEISVVLGNISKGNLDVSTQENYKGNFTEIRESLNNISSSLKEVFLNIKQASNIVNSNSEQLSSTSQILSSRASEQADSVDKLSNYIDKINEQVRNNAENAESTNSITSDLIKEIEDSNNKMKDMLSAMDNIEIASKNIGNIINTINEIASQTDLLALNAAIEAARAGEAGKGFAVVADEVRSLSGQSADAVNQSNALIKNCIQAVSNGKDLANSTDESLRKLLNKIAKATELVSKINNASTEQAESISRVHSDILKISSVIQENSATAQESAAASQELNSQSELLNEMIDRFKVH